MTVQSPAAVSIVPDRACYRAGEISALTLAISYVVITVLFAQVGAPPPGGDGEAWLSYLPGKTTLWWIILGLSVFTDFLYIPITYALYLGLKKTHRHLMLLASAFVGLFVVLDLAITWAHYASILTLYRGYAAATDDLHRMAYIAAVNGASAILASRLEVVYAIVTLSLGILLIGFALLRAGFNKPAAYLGLLTGALGILALTASSVAIIGNAVAATLWLFFVAYQLDRLARGRDPASTH